MTKIWAQWVVMLAISGLVGCGASVHRQSIYTEGMVPVASPPSVVGERAEHNHVTLTGSIEEIMAEPDRARRTDAGGSGNNVVQRQLRGALAVGVSERVEVGFMGRYASSEWERATQSSDAPDNIRRSLWGMGMTLRVGMLETRSRVSLNFEGELEVMALPYHRLVLAHVTTRGDDFDPWHNFTTESEEQSSVLFGTYRLGLGLVWKADGLNVFGGAGVQHLPQVIGHQDRTVNCEGLNCDGELDAGDMPVLDSARVAASFYGGVELLLGRHLSILATGFSSAPLEGEGLGQNAYGGSLALRLKTR